MQVTPEEWQDSVRGNVFVVKETFEITLKQSIVDSTSFWFEKGDVVVPLWWKPSESKAACKVTFLTRRGLAFRWFPDHGFNDWLELLV